MRVLIITAAVLLVCFSVSAQPWELWNHSAGATIRHDLLLGDFGTSVGQETIYTLDEPAKLVCLGPDGGVQWDFALEGNAKVTGMAAGTGYFPQSDALIAVGGDQDLACVYAASGKLYWREIMAGGLGAGGLMWVDVDGDYKEELLSVSVDNVLFVRSFDGKELWRYTKTDHANDLKIVGAMAGGDVNNNKTNDVVLPLERSVLALDGDGVMIWESAVDRETLGSPVIADCDGNVFAEVYVLAQNPLGLLALDGDIGTERWFLPLDEAGFNVEGSRSSILVADLNQDGFKEIVLSDGNNTAVVVAKEGKELWRHTFSGGGARLGAADIDGDLQVELLATTADGFLHQLGPWGDTEWSEKYTESLLFSPVILDVNRDAIPDVLIVDGEGNVKCLRTNENYIASLMLWPMARQTLVRDGQARNLGTWKTNETENPLVNGTFEQSASAVEGQTAQPAGWELADAAAGQWGVGEEQKRDGRAALWVEPADGASATIRSEAIALPVGTKSLSGSVQAMGAGASRVSLQWFGIGDSPLREDVFTAQAPQEEWVRYSLNSSKAPEGSRTAVLSLESKGGGGVRVWWDAAQLEASVSQTPVVEILHNQVAYESYAPKKFVVRSNWKAKDAKFFILSELGEVLHEGKLTWGVHFKAGGESNWPGYYWRGDFSEFHGLGKLRIGVNLDGERSVSAVFEQGLNSLWDNVSTSTVGALTAALCEGAAAWRTELDGGALRTPELFWELAQMRRVCAWRFAKMDADQNNQDDLLQLLLSVGKSIAASIKEDGSPDLKGVYAACGLEGPAGGADESALATMGLARLAKQMDDLEPEMRQLYIDAAARGLDWSLAQGMKGPMQFNTAVDLYLLTQDSKYVSLAHELFPKMDFSWVAPALSTDAPQATEAGDTIESVIEYESNLTDEIYSLYQSVEAAKAADELVHEAKNPFGAFMYGGGEKLQFFAPEATLEKISGHTRHILDAAAFVAQVYRFQPKPEYHDFVYDQINWLMGCNPFGLCLVTGMGHRIAPKYRYPAGMEDGETVAGLLPRGPVAMGLGDDRPLFEVGRAETSDFPGNEVDLYNTVALLKVMANIRRMPLGLDDK